GAEYHACPVVLETLGGVDAAHLVETAFVGGPIVRFGRVGYAVVRFRVPRACPVADPDVVDQGFAVVGLYRVAPFPAEPGGDAGGTAVSVGLGLHPSLDLVG